MIPLKVVDHLYHRADVGCGMLQHGAVCVGYQVIPLGGSAVSPGKVGQGGMRLIHQQSHGSHGNGSVHTFTDLPEHGVAPEVRTVKALHHFLDGLRQQQHPCAPVQHGLGFGGGIRHPDRRGQLRLFPGVYIYNIAVFRIRLRDFQGQGQTMGDLRLRQPGFDLSQGHQLHGCIRQREAPGGKTCISSSQPPVGSAGQTGAVAPELYLRPEEFSGGIVEPVKFCQQHNVRAEAPPLLFGNQPLAVHKGIQHAHQRRALSGEIL
ncbi:unknown [Ruminococcus sp. CAG:379]|nr:unknown [Ruminococcus sp. CAG:379]